MYVCDPDKRAPYCDSAICQTALQISKNPIDTPAVGPIDGPGGVFNKWTTTKPVEPGWYWAREGIDPLDDDIYMVFVCDDLEVCLSKNDMIFYVNHFIRWSGPLTPPDFP